MRLVKAVAVRIRSGIIQEGQQSVRGMGITRPSRLFGLAKASSEAF